MEAETALICFIVIILCVAAFISVCIYVTDEKSKGNERWKNDGNCKKCRRRDYCSTKCKAKKKIKER